MQGVREGKRVAQLVERVEADRAPERGAGGAKESGRACAGVGALTAVPYAAT